LEYFTEQIKVIIQLSNFFELLKIKCMINQQHFVGIDVSKDWLDVFVRTSKKHFKTSNDKQGYSWMIKRIVEDGFCANDVLFCFENTGMYSTMLARFMSSSNYAFVLAHPLDVKLSGGATRGKSDKIDAVRLADYAYRKREELKPSKASDQSTDRLRILFALRQQLVKSRAAFMATKGEYITVLGLKLDDPIIEIQTTMIEELTKHITHVNDEITSTLQAHSDLKHNYDLLLSVPGIGPVVATAMLMYTDNFTKFSTARKFCNYCGFTPYEHQSGSSINRKRKTSRLANKEMKSLVDRGALSIIEHDEDMKNYFERKTAEGKEKRVVINAVRCKIVYRAFKVVKEQRTYIKKFTDYQQYLQNAA
jgi:transposase